MIRLMLTLAPVACVLAAIAISSLLETYFAEPLVQDTKSKIEKKEERPKKEDIKSKTEESKKTSKKNVVPK
jgi:hypothetical protein